jgi:hypothetical protein
VTYKTGFGLDDWIYCTLYINTVRDYMQYSAIAIVHTFHFTAAHARGFLVFTSRILATGLSKSHCHFNSHVKSSCHSLLPFLQFLLSDFGLPSPELDVFSRLLFCTPCHSASTSTVKVKVRVTLLLTVGQSVSQQVLVSSPIWGS